MEKRSLGYYLQKRWWLHTLGTSFFFIGGTFFFLFAAEDYFHKLQLKDISNIVSLQGSISGMPQHIDAHFASNAPYFLKQFSEGLEMGRVIETTDPQGEIIHLIKGRFSDSGVPFYLVSYESRTQSIFENADKLLLLLMPWVSIFLVWASLVSRRFIGNLQREFVNLLNIINKSETPLELHDYSERQSVKELSDFSGLFAKIWDEKLEILARERQGLEYLSHELRTPIQSSKATLELLSLKLGNDDAFRRLDRALNRMTRLSNAILCLMESDTKPSKYPISVEEICMQLIDEFTPLIESKHQIIVFENLAQSQELIIEATQEVTETLISILLMNAIQHSNSQPIVVSMTEKQLSVKNRSRYTNNQTSVNGKSQQFQMQSYGIGLTIARRLATLFNLQLKVMFYEESVVEAIITIEENLKGFNGH